jgi:ABC-type multidrug transport system ATPase subunit
MSELVLGGLYDGPLLGVEARFGAGSWVVLGADAAALSTLVALVAGSRAPRRGVVRYAGHVAHATPELRRITAALLADEALPAVGRVSDAVQAILAARGDRRPARALLDEVGLGNWGAREARDLDASERRSLALGLALTHADARLVALYEPLAAGRSLGADFVRNGVARAVDRGAVVLVATQSLEDARLLGGEPTLLHHGVLTSAANVPLGSPVGGDQTFVVETPDARRLTAALAREPAVRGVRWNEERAPETVLVYGSDTERLASAIVKILSEESLGVRSLALSRQPLPSLLAASAVTAPAYPYGAQPQQPYPYGAPPQQPSPYGAPPQQAYSYGAPPQQPSPYGAVPASPHQAYAPLPADPARGDTTAPAPANQSVGMPTAFADPTKPPGGRS